MQPLSDILIMFTKALDDAAMRKAKASLTNCAASVLVHQKDGQSRVLLVKFDPHDITIGALLAAVRNAGFDATMAGG